MSELDLSKVMPGWTQEGILGSGTFGTVYLVRNTETGTFSAVKVIKMPPAKESIDNAVKLGIGRDLLSTYFGKFKNDLSWELTMYKTVKSAYLASVEDILTVDAEGPGWTGFIRTGIYTPMATYFEKSPSTQEEAARLGTELASALDALTQYSMVHGEIKPENVFVNDAGAFVLADYGIRRCLEKAGSGIFGAEEDGFEAPEVGEERRYTAQSDIYSLGALMCYVANGCQMPPNRDPANIRGIDPGLSAVIKKAMAAAPEQRYQTAMQLKIELARLTVGKKPARRAMAAAAAFDAVKKNGGAAITSGAVITGRGVTREKPEPRPSPKSADTDTLAGTARAHRENEEAERKKNSKAGAIVALIAALLVLAVILAIWMPWKKTGGTNPGGTDQAGDTGGISDGTDRRPEETGDRPGGTETGPGGTQTEPSEPDDTDTKPSEPQETEPEATKPKDTEPEATKPQETEPEPTKPQETEPEPTKPEPPNNDILYPTDKQVITREELESRTRDEIGLILNEMYARHGYIFSAGGKTQSYFESQKWYEPVTTNASKVVSQFNETEQKNIAVITDYQREMGWRGGGSGTTQDPPSTEDVPPATEDVPPSTEDVPPSTEDVPPATEDVPPATEDVPPATEDVPPATDEPPAREDDYLYPSDKQVITREELDSMERTQIGYILNEIYARHGYIFTGQEFRDYFGSKSWYHPVTNDQNVIVSMFNDIEAQNKSIIYAYQREKGWR